jgi:hypothetical protein
MGFMMSIRPNHTSFGITCLAICCVAFLTAGCGGMKYGAAKISSEPSGAEIINLKDDTNLGQTPANVVWQDKEGLSEQVTIQLRKNGYRSAITSLWVNKRFSSKDEAMDNAIDVHTELDKQ